MSDPYASIGGGGKLKLKGVKDSKITKKKKPSKAKTLPHGQHPASEDQATTNDDFKDTSIILKTLDKQDSGPSQDACQEPARAQLLQHTQPRTSSLTEAQQRHQAAQRRRLEERMKKEGGPKTHREKVEEYNRYLSGLSEHHDMPKIGPG